MKRGAWPAAVCAAWLAAGCAAMMAGGCAGTRVRPEGLAVSVSPEIVRPGDVVTLRAASPVPLAQAQARLDWPGSPRVSLRTADQGLTWKWVTQIPVDAVWQPGRYRVVVEGRTKEGEVLAGESWITAP
jgi:hypothetical protein